MMKSPESLVTKHVLQGVLELSNVWFVCFSHFVTNATWSILGAARLISLREGVFRSFNQSNNQSLYLRVRLDEIVEICDYREFLDH